MAQNYSLEKWNIFVVIFFLPAIWEVIKDSIVTSSVSYNSTSILLYSVQRDEFHDCDSLFIFLKFFSITPTPNKSSHIKS